MHDDGNPVDGCQTHGVDDIFGALCVPHRQEPLPARILSNRWLA